MVVVVTGEAAVRCSGEPGWGRERVVAELGPGLPAPSNGKMRQVKACALPDWRKLRSRVWTGAVRCISLLESRSSLGFRERWA